MRAIELIEQGGITVEPFVDVAFPLKGRSLPLDHGYALFAAVSRVVPVLHEQERWGLFPVHGMRVGPGELALSKSSLLSIRLPANRIADVLLLSGKTLEVVGHELTVGVLRVFPLHGAPELRSRFVTIKKFHEEKGPFEEAVRRQLESLDVGPSAQVSIGGRRVVKVANHTIVGFATSIGGLTAGESIRVQTQGIGGRRHMGAGLFLPASKT